MATNKQKALAKKIVENPTQTMAEAMLSVGYSEASASKPSEVTQSKGWAELMEKYLPDDDLLEVHKDGLKAMKQISALVMVKEDKDGKGQTVYKKDEGVIEVEDHATRAKYLELGYKVKGKIGKETIGLETKDGDKTTRIIITRGE